MNTIYKIGEDGYPIYGEDFVLVEGMQIGKLKVIERVSHPENKAGIWYKCECECGEVVIKRKDNLKAGALRGGPYAQKNKGARTCGSEKCNKSGIKNRNTNGLIISSHQEETVGGIKILKETDYIDMSNRSTIVICECPRCGQLYPSTRRSQAVSCGCAIGRPVRSLEDYMAQRCCRSQGELKIMKMLESAGVPFIQEKKFIDCKNVMPLPFDFYLNSPNYGEYVIEFDGEQHFKSVPLFENFQERRERDLKKNKYCWDNNIKIIRIPFNANFELNDLSIATTRFLLTPENEEDYYARSNN